MILVFLMLINDIQRLKIPNLMLLNEENCSVLATQNLNKT